MRSLREKMLRWVWAFIVFSRCSLPPQMTRSGQPRERSINAYPAMGSSPSQLTFLPSPFPHRIQPHHGRHPYHERCRLREGRASCSTHCVRVRSPLAYRSMAASRPCSTSARSGVGPAGSSSPSSSDCRRSSKASRSTPSTSIRTQRSLATSAPCVVCARCCAIARPDRARRCRRSGRIRTARRLPSLVAQARSS
jgi:hypothetical protein